MAMSNARQRTGKCTARMHNAAAALLDTSFPPSI